MARLPIAPPATRFPAVTGANTPVLQRKPAGVAPPPFAPCARPRSEKSVSSIPVASGIHRAVPTGSALQRKEGPVGHAATIPSPPSRGKARSAQPQKIERGLMHSSPPTPRGPARGGIPVGTSMPPTQFGMPVIQPFSYLRNAVAGGAYYLGQARNWWAGGAAPPAGAAAGLAAQPAAGGAAPPPVAVALAPPPAAGGAAPPPAAVALMPPPVAVALAPPPAAGGAAPPPAAAPAPLRPYGAFRYTESATRKILNQSENRPSPVTGEPGHPRQHVGKPEKAEQYAYDQGRTKSVYLLAADQDAAVAAALSSPAGVAALAALDARPAVATRCAFTAAASGKVTMIKAKKKTGAAAGVVKSWQYHTGQSQSITIVLDSMGTGRPGDIHIQTAFPIL